MTSLTPSRADANRQQNAVNLIARHLADRPAKHIRRRILDNVTVWLVESQSKPGTVYTVTLTADGWPANTCDCEDCRTRHMECKHIRAALALAQPAQPAPAAPTPAPIAWTSDSRRNRKRTEWEEEI